MSKHETKMTRWYWKQVGGTLIEEFPAIKKGPSWGARLLDGIIIKKGENKIAHPSDVNIEGKEIIIVQSKNKRLCMPLMGQTLFSVSLMRKFHPKSIESVALCSETDTVLERLFLKHKHCKVVVCPKSICRATRISIIKR